MGKRTTTRHKEDNTFTYKSNAQKIKDILKKEKPVNIKERQIGDDGTTALLQCLQTNSEKNNSEDFLEIANNLTQHGKTVASILHEKPAILSYLLRRLSMCTDLGPEEGRLVLFNNTFNEILEILEAIAQDIGEEMVKPFNSFREIVESILLALLKHDQAEMIEAGFNCISQLFQILRKYLVPQFTSCLDMLTKFWTPNVPNHVIILSAQSLVVLAWKSWERTSEIFFQSLNKLLSSIEYETKESKPKMKVLLGVSSLLTHMLVGPGMSLNLNAVEFIQSCLKSLDLYERNFHCWVYVLEEVVSSLKEDQIWPVFEVVMDVSTPSPKSMLGTHLKLILWNAILKKYPDLLGKNWNKISETFDGFINAPESSPTLVDTIVESMVILMKTEEAWTNDAILLKKIIALFSIPKLEKLRQMLIQSNIPFEKYKTFLIDAYMQELSCKEAAASFDVTKSVDPQLYVPTLLLKFTSDEAQHNRHESQAQSPLDLQIAKETDVGEYSNCELLRLATEAFENRTVCQNRTIVPILQRLTSAPLLESDRSRLYNFALQYLMAPSWLSTEILKFLISLKQDDLKAYESLLLEIQENKNSDNLLRLGEDIENPSIRREHRVDVIPVVLRILFQNCKGKKPSERKTILRCIASFQEGEIREYIQLVVDSSENQLEGSSKSSKLAVLSFCKSFMTILGYKNPNLIETLMGLVCDIYGNLKEQNDKKGEVTTTIDASNDMIEEDDNDETDRDVLEDDLGLTMVEKNKCVDPQTKKSIKMARKCILNLFIELPALKFSESLLGRIFNEILGPALFQTSRESSWIESILNEWSLNSRLHSLFLRRIVYEGVVTSPIMCIFNDLKETSGKTLEDRLHTLMNLLDKELNHGDEIVPLTCNPYPSDALCNGSEPIGLQIIAWGWIEYIVPLLNKPSILKIFCTRGGQKFEVILRLTKPVDDPEWARELSRLIINLAKTSRVPDDVYNFIEMLQHVERQVSVEDQTHLLIDLSSLFGSSFPGSTDRKIREALCKVLDSTHHKDLREIMEGLNSWESGLDNIPNYELRQKSYSSFKSKIGTMDTHIFQMIAHHCFYVLNEITDLEHSSAVDTLQAISRHEVSTNNSDDIKNLINTTVLPAIELGVQHQEYKKFIGFLRVLDSFILNCHSLHGTLKELKFVQEYNILEGLWNTKVHMRTRAMNKLAKALEEFQSSSDKYISPSNLIKYILPITLYYLLYQEASGDNINELIDASIEALSKLLDLVPFKTYFHILECFLREPDKLRLGKKQRRRTLIAILDAFNFNLSALNENAPARCRSSDFLLRNFDFRVMLNKNQANLCLQKLTKDVIPKIRELANLSEKSSKFNGKKNTLLEGQAEPELMMTTSFVKLLKKLPSKYSEELLRPLIPSFCASMRNKQHSARDVNRRILTMLLTELGHTAFSQIVNHLSGILRKGYERHVLSYTISKLVQNCEELLLGHSVPSAKLIEICETELFSEMSEEKNIQAIQDKTMEARNDNAAPILKFCAKIAKDDKIIKKMVQVPMKNLQQQFKANNTMVGNAQQWFGAVRQGIMSNTTLSFDQIMSLLFDQLNSLSTNQNQKIEEKIKIEKIEETLKKSTYLLDIFLTEEAHPKYPHVDSIIVEFIYDILLSQLRMNHVDSKTAIGFRHHLLNGMDGPTKKIELLSMRCLNKMFEFGFFYYEKDNEFLNNCWKKIILKMSTSSLSGERDVERVNVIFKFISAILGSFLVMEILVDDYKEIVNSIKCFLTHDDCSTRALDLLRKLVRRQFISKELKDVMNEVRSKSITSLVEHVRDGCRQAYMEYFPTCKETDEILTFYIDNLKYRNAYGRESAVLSLNSMLPILPKKMYERNASSLFMKIILAVDHEFDENVRTKLCKTFEILLSQESTIKQFVDCFCTLIGTDVARGACSTLAQLAGIMLSTVGIEYISTRVDTFILFFEWVLTLDPFTVNIWKYETMIEDEAISHVLDCLIQTSSAYENNNPFMGGRIPVLIRDKILHCRNDWIRVKSLELIELMVCKTTGIIGHMKGELDAIEGKCPLFNKLSDISDLIQKLTSLFDTPGARHVRPCLDSLSIIAVHLSGPETDLDILDTLMQNLRHIVTTEVTNEPEEYIKRTSAYDIYQTILTEAKKKDEFKERVGKYLSIMFRHCVRDTTDNNTPGEVVEAAQEMLNTLKKYLGFDKYQNMYAKTMADLTTKRQENKAKKRENVILHPELKRKRSVGAKKKKPVNKRGGKKKKIG